MKERTFLFGKNEHLVGVLCEPNSSKEVHRPAVIFLNAGTLHHVGPFGWYVTLARQLAGIGYYSLRFDLAGIGDSGFRNEAGSDLDRAIGDIREAMDLLSRKNIANEFILLGLCAGALFGHHAALQDSRVLGVVFLDGYGYRTLGYLFRYYSTRFFRLSSWIGQIKRIYRRILSLFRPTPITRGPVFEDYFLEFPPRLRVQKELEELEMRGTQLLFLYTGGLAHQYFNHRKQFAEMFGKLDRSTAVQVYYDEQADHLYSEFEHRQRMMDRIMGWLKESRWNHRP